MNPDYLLVKNAIKSRWRNLNAITEGLVSEGWMPKEIFITEKGLVNTKDEIYIAREDNFETDEELRERYF
jgi:hypothetical protein